ncbi:hypothetical protein CRE_12012 [Caenorhabditis remanei]|uniref:Uncharacterized protein n=1 Tax=Caenorhabditis remanei TaxID=31234 RepID=E3MPR1_CAERE|nr:hypothetical protein CRE_12012 [Caenorhabditis remanei]
MVPVSRMYHHPDEIRDRVECVV